MLVNPAAVAASHVPVKLPEVAAEVVTTPLKSSTSAVGCGPLSIALNPAMRCGGLGGKPETDCPIKHPNDPEASRPRRNAESKRNKTRSIGPVDTPTGGLIVPVEAGVSLDKVNYHTLADFRVEKERELDEQVLAALSQEGLITLEQVMQDSTKIKAQANARSYRQEDRFASIWRRRDSAWRRWAIPGTTRPVRKQSKPRLVRGARNKSG